VRHGYHIGVPAPGIYHEVLNSDAPHYGGSGVVNDGDFTAYPAQIHEMDQAITVTLPPLGVCVFHLQSPD
jgi:1,4-alpha-glucan branching enzyme